MMMELQIGDLVRELALSLEMRVINVNNLQKGIVDCEWTTTKGKVLKRFHKSSLKKIN